jgi:phosphatidylserine/phosphatidylglycerophosphate/cardiolipin synthase-like enzyme
LDHEQIVRAQRTLDIAMYSFTDLYLAQDLKDLATRLHVHIRIYRDREQFMNEQHHSDRFRNYVSTTDFLHGVPGIEIRVKANSSRDLMHLKAYIRDRLLLRDGSANWSPAGLKNQDNTLRFTDDPTEIERFDLAFQSMWGRKDNLRVQ